VELSPEQVKAALDAGEPLLLLDCREDGEVSICRLPDALHIPMGQTPGRMDELPRERDVVVYCHHGVRSLQVAGFLRQRGFERVWSMAGGIDAWSRRIDPTVPRY